MKKRFKVKLDLRLLVLLAMLLAVKFVLGLFTVEVIPRLLKVGPSFLVNAIIGSLAGPVISAVTFAVYDVMAMFISGKASNFIIWFTVIEAVQGFLYGFFFYGKRLNWKSKKDWLYVLFSVSVTMGIATFFLTPLVLQWYYHVPFWAQFLGGRALKILEIPLRVVVIMLFLPQVQRIPEWQRKTRIKKYH